MALVRQRINPELENDLLTALITSPTFIEKVRKWYQPHYFSDYGRIIAQWVMDYWAKYSQAPGKNIQSIFNVEHEKLPHALARNVATYLENLSSTYESASEFNEPYMVEQAQAYFKRKAYEHLFNQGRELVLAGQMDEAVKLHEQFRGVASVTSRWENPLDQRVIRQHFSEMEDDTYTVLNFNGALGQLVRPLERGWLVAFLGPMKRGKSFWIQETLFRAAASRKRAAYVNLEMIPKGVRERQYMRLTGLGNNHNGRPVQFPLFDCYYNQCGECPVPDMRTNDMTLRRDDADRSLPKWGSSGQEDYRVCTACRDEKELRKHWLPDVWYTWYKPEREFTEETVIKTAAGFMRQYGDRIRQITYPAYSVNISDIQRDLEELAWADNFRPDVVLVDYADIVDSETRTSSEREHLNQVWKAMKRAAGEMQALWVTASQTNRAAIDKALVGQKDVAEDIRKLAHVDAMYAINQTANEKDDLITRISTLAHRHHKVGRGQVAVLHQLDIGLPYIDSEWWQ